MTHPAARNGPTLVTETARGRGDTVVSHEVGRRGPRTVCPQSRSGLENQTDKRNQDEAHEVCR